MTIIRSFCCCGTPRSSVLASRPFRESEFIINEKDVRRSLQLDGRGVEGFLEDMEPPQTSLGHCLIEMFGKYHDLVVQVNAATGEILKYKDVLAEALALAAGLRSFGVTPGKLIGLLAAPNDPKVNTILVASLILGAVLHPIDPTEKLSDEKLEALLEKKPRVVFCSEEHTATVAQVKSDKTSIISINGKAKPDVNHPVDGVVYFQNVLKGEEGIVDLTDLGPRDVLIVLQGQTSNDDIVLTNEILLKHSTRRRQLKGELGRGLLLDYEDWSSASLIIRRLFLFRAGGGTIVSAPSYEPETTLALVQKHRITWLALQLSQMSQLQDCQAIMGYDLSSLQMVSAPWIGSALYAKNDAMHDSLRERLPATRVVITTNAIACAIPTRS